MSIKKKLSLGLGFLFLIIFVLVAFSSFQVSKLSKDAANILKDNYASLVYSKNMMSAADDMMAAAGSRVGNLPTSGNLKDYHAKLFESGRGQFESNLKAENTNVTEVHEKDYVEKLNADYAVYVNLCLQIMKGEGNAALFFGELQPAYMAVKQSIGNINDVNMQAVERKSEISKQDSARIIAYVAALGVFSLILAFFYFSYFPSYVSNSISYLTGRTRELLRKADITLNARTDDEAQILRHAIELLDDALTAEAERRSSDGPRS